MARAGALAARSASLGVYTIEPGYVHARVCAAEARRQRGGMPAATTSLAKTFIGTLATHGPFLQQRRTAAAFLLGKGDSARVIEAPGHMPSREE